MNDEELEHQAAHLMAEARPSNLGKPGPASIRYNNPGAMWPGPSSRKYNALGKKDLQDGQGNKIAIFWDTISGGAALFDLLDRIYTNMTVAAAIQKWSGGNSVASYLSVLQQRGGIQPDEMITHDKLRNPEWAIRFAKAMAWHEAGREYPMSDEQWLWAHREAFSYSLAETPAKKALAKTSEKHKVAGKAKAAAGMMGLGAGGLGAASETVTQVKTITDTVHGFMASYGLFVLAAVGVVGFLVFQWMQDRTEKDYEEGRYEPSGGSK